MGKVPLIIRATPTDIGFSNYIFDKRHSKIHSIVRGRRYKVSETNESYRVINHWDKIGILPDGVKNVTKGWRRFNLIERVWLEAVKKLQAFGLPLEKIALVQRNVMRWNKKEDAYFDFEYFVMKAWMSSTDPYILILENGEADVGSLEDIELSKMIWGHKDILLISIKSILERMGLTVKRAKVLFDLDESEVELLSQIRVEAADEIKVKGKGAISEIESSFTSTKPSLPHEIRSQAKHKRMYGSITEQYEDGERRSVRITSKRRFK